MAGIYLTGCKTVTHDGAQVEGLLTVRETHRKVQKSHAGDGLPPVYDHVGDEMTLALTFSSQKAATDFMGNDESNLVMTAGEFGEAAAKTYTIKNVEALDESTEFPELRGQAAGSVSVNARANFGEADTRATMITVT